ncbi:cell wall protein PhiA [Colletotrichum sublineola]|uniref:Putative cell wall protein PhiA n=1 Tax=Colletotrichum sublineola TaxID=1173701 RepID=A0A066WT73_COLSU|nr:cell wall protein PhiA [Colletotrichum sublineola]KDN60098.1 putative cell wall protein PhiA [Colletotrichum sublineola]
MQFTNALAVAATLASVVSGATIPQHKYMRRNVTEASKFKLQVINTDTPIQLQYFQAAKGSIFVGLPQQNASCDNPAGQPTEQEATFTLSADGSLWLFNGQEEPQTIFVDRSGMGQGKLGYTTGAQPMVRNGERTGWTIDKEDYVSLQGSKFIACPNSIEGSWSVWVDAGIANPGWNKGCVPISARAVDIPNPVACEYSA